MSLKQQSLGNVGAVAAGILITSGTNAIPIVATITAGHRLKNGDRIVITGVTGLTGMNGEWEIERVTDTTYKLLGSVGNGAFGGTAVVAVLCDKTPFMPRHSAVGVIGNTPGAAVFVGTALFEGSDDNSSFADALAPGSVAIPAASAGIGITVEIPLKKYMRFRASAFTSGAANAQLLA